LNNVVHSLPFDRLRIDGSKVPRFPSPPRGCRRLRSLLISDRVKECNYAQLSE
jgi:hypothetical protein